MGSMKRIDVLKGIEQILVQKAYETGHISHRADGDWQKQADGSWIPYKGQSDQSVPQTQKPTKNTEYGEITKQDFENVPDSVKDKMFTIAQQYQSEWAEDSDEDIRSMAEDDVEAISQMLWDNADEETRNSWLGEEDLNEDNSEVDLYDADQVDLAGYANNINIDGGVADNDDLEDVANQILLDNNLEVNDDNMNKARNAMLSWLDANGYLGEEDLNEDIFSKEAYAQDEEDRKNMSNQDVIKHIVAENHDYDADIKNIEFRKDDDGEFVPHDDDYYAVVDKIWADLDLGDSYTEEDWEDEDSEANAVYSYLVDTVIDRAYELNDNVLNVANHPLDTVNKSYRDMRSTPTVKNMGF